MMQHSEPEFQNINDLIYQPGRFEYLMKDPLTIEIWNFLKTSNNINLMIKATDLNKAAIDFLLSEIESLFGKFLNSSSEPDDNRPVMINNMIKQIMNQLGYEHTGCTLLPNARYIKASGMYKKNL